MNTTDKSIDELMERAAALIVRSIEAEEAAEAAEKEKNRVAEECKRVSEQEKEVKKKRKMQDVRYMEKVNEQKKSLRIEPVFQAVFDEEKRCIKFVNDYQHMLNAIFHSRNTSR